MIFWLYLADRVDVITKCISGFFGVLSICTVVLLFIGGLIFITIDTDEREYFNQLKDFIINTIKKYKLSYICIILVIIYIVIPSKSLIYTKVAFDVGSVVVEKLSPIQQKAFRSVELFLDDYIESKEKEIDKKED